MNRSQIMMLFEANIRVDGLWVLPTPMPGEEFLNAWDGKELKHLPLEARNLVESWDESEREPLFEGDSTSARDAWEFLSSIMPQPMITIQVSTPVQKYWAEGSASYSWGHTYFETHAACDMDELIAKVLHWQEECDKRDREKAQQKSA